MCLIFHKASFGVFASHFSTADLLFLIFLVSGSI